GSQSVCFLWRRQSTFDRFELTHQRRRQLLEKLHEGAGSNDQDHRVPETPLEVQRACLFVARLFPEAMNLIDFRLRRLADRLPDLNPTVLDFRPTRLDPEQDWALRVLAHKGRGVLD